MIITVGSTKGGVGKSTLAIQLALARTLRGFPVLLVDGDRQGSAQAAIAARADAGRLPGVACVHYPDERLLRAQVQQQAPSYDTVIVDVGGRDSAALRMALLLTDLLIVPVVPRSLDVWAFADMAGLVDGAQEARADRGRPPLCATALLNMADPTGSDNGEAIVALKEFAQFAVLNPVIRRRKAYANAAGLGLAVTEMSPRDRKACEEIEKLVYNAFTIAESLHTNAKETV